MNECIFFDLKDSRFIDDNAINDTKNGINDKKFNLLMILVVPKEAT